MTFRPPPSHPARMAFSGGPFGRRLIPQLPVQATHRGVCGGRDCRGVAADDTRDCQRTQAGLAGETGFGWPIAIRARKRRLVPMASRRGAASATMAEVTASIRSAGAVRTRSVALSLPGRPIPSSRCTVIGLTPAARAIVC